MHDEINKSYLAASTISLEPEDRHIQTDGDGFFAFENLNSGNYLLIVRYIGYDELRLPIALSVDTIMHLHLKPSSYMLKEVTVNAINNRNGDRIAPLPVEEVSRDYMLQHNSTNFVQTLASLAGVASMDIGAGFSKPVIRGLGFNRVAVVDKGIVQQNQQWGADHGLEIDQYDVDHVRVHKGPMSLFYGSDAIGGVIEIMPVNVPEEDMFWGDATLVGKSNNDLLGASVVVNKKKNNLFFRGRATVQSYADYRIPADTIEYLTWKMPVYDRRMKNTAGREYNLSLSTNYSNDNFGTWLHISNINAKNGFYPGAHGIPQLGRLEPDGSFRNVDMPYATSNHFKLISNSEWRLHNLSRVNLDLGYQNNYREELSEFHTHYSNQQPPLTDPDVELRFVLNTFSANLRLVGDENKRWNNTFGVSSEFQHNRVGGYSFLLPEFNRLSAGVFWLNRLNVTDRISLSGGLRYDIGKLDIEGFYDPVLEEYLLMQGYESEQVDFYAQRAAGIKRTFSDLSGSVGIDFKINHYNLLKVNIGRSFRYPGANELASNGVHHGAFRHEMGNEDLDSEKGYQLDIDYQYTGRRLNIRLNPFVTWFTNYIFLEPSGNWSVLPHAGQVYSYRQSEAFMAGGELMVDYRFNENWSVASDIEYLYNINLTDNYPLPFSPPTVATNSLDYSGTGRGLLLQYTVGIENRWVMAQNRIAKNEDKTPGTNLWNLSAQAHWNIDDRRVITQFRADNIFNRSYLNHLSFYRKLNAPEPGRNIQLIVKILF